LAIPLEVVTLNRMGFGPRPGDVERVRAMGFAAYVDEQLAPVDADDPLYDKHLKAARLHIQYDAGRDDQNHDYRACNEDRPLKWLDQPLAELWKLLDPNVARAGDERVRPLREVIAATWLRAVYSKWQLREVLVDFWHNHFNVNADMDDPRIAPAFPVYDRDVIRKHCLGNFRHLLEAAATSIPVLVCLNNASSKSGPAVENFARELFERHTLGVGSYFNLLYDRWREVPGAADGKPAGYIDQDVYEAARAFTGWTVADGTDPGNGDAFPNTGEFHYCSAWHDDAPKRVLGTELAPGAAALADGRRVLDLVANHPETARNLCRKLCVRLVADDPPAALVDRAAAAWVAARDKPDQIAQTVRLILLSPEFAATWGQKVKRPFELVASFLRATEADVRVGDGLFGILDRMGQPMFAWPTGEGCPDATEYWLDTNLVLTRWNLAPSLLTSDGRAAVFRLGHATSTDANTWRAVYEFWVGRMIGRALPEATTTLLLNTLTNGEDPDQALSLNEKDLIDRVQQLVTLIAMTPEFQER
jgi:uncharacterized protein (DUF1800 family)